MKRRPWTPLAFAALSLVLIASLFMMSQATQGSARFGQRYSVLLVINAVGLAGLVILIALQVRRLVRDLRLRRAGAQLTLRMLVLFAGLALTPVIIVYGFSLDFLRRGIDSWFDVRIADAMEDALKLSRNALDQRMQGLLKQTERLAGELADDPIRLSPIAIGELGGPADSEVTDPSLPADLDALRARAGADELVLLTRSGRIVASSSELDEMVPNIPSQSVLLHLRQGRSYIGLDPIRDSALMVRVVVGVAALDPGRDPGVLQALYPVSPHVNRLADNVQSAYEKYKELAYLREQLKLGFAMTLTLVLLMSALGAIWAAFYSAHRLTAPIRDLAEGTRAVAGGNYGQALHVAARDDLGFLVESFNEMTRRLALARDEARLSQAQVEAQRAYLEAVLARLSSGVLTLDAVGRVRTANPSAAKILGLEPHGLLDQGLEEIAGRHAHLTPLMETLLLRTRGTEDDWSAQLQVFGAGGRQVLICRGTRLSSGSSESREQVIVFDDVTALIQGQRDAAWSEVARRLAHEIKNPLTPIQLSAERIRQKYLAAQSGREAEVLDRLTHTIVQQVETMKQMVNTFSEYARTPPLQIRPCRLNDLIEETVELYRSLPAHPVIELKLDAALPVLSADAGRMRQVLNNLIKNAIEASEEPPPRLAVSTRRIEESDHGYLELRVSDRGRGIAEELRQQVFEPYVSHKARGTGLGLAIVKRIVEEHGGIVWLENNPEAGASAVIRLPLSECGYTEQSPNREPRHAQAL